MWAKFHLCGTCVTGFRKYLWAAPKWIILNRVRNSCTECKFFTVSIINPIQDELFQGCSRIGGGGQKCPPLPKICHTYPAMMKLGTVIPYPKKTQKMYKSRDTPLEFS